MKYLVRAIKYFFYFAVLTSVIVLALVLIGAVEGNIETIFRGGYSALWQIALFYAVIAAVYPSVAFIRKCIRVAAPLGEVRDEIVEYMRQRHYEVESESAESIDFRIRGAGARLAKMYEDRIVIRGTLDGIQIEGLRKDVIRLAAGLETKLDIPQG